MIAEDRHVVGDEADEDRQAAFWRRISSSTTLNDGRQRGQASRRSTWSCRGAARMDMVTLTGCAGSVHRRGFQALTVAGGLGEGAQVLQEVVDGVQVGGAPLVHHLQQAVQEVGPERLVLAQQLLAQPLARTEARHADRQLGRPGAASASTRRAIVRIGTSSVTSSISTEAGAPMAAAWTTSQIASEHADPVASSPRR